MRNVALLGVMGLVGAALLVSGDARACGGCFHEAPTPQKPVVESSVVSDHRMVLSLAPSQTILWDQIRYTGDPAEFAWVLPVRPGTTIELSRDEWIAALDATTQPTIIQPRTTPVGGFGGGGGFSGGDGLSNGGCGCGSMTTSSDSAGSAGFADAGSSASADAGPPPVQVIRQEVVGPYETVIVRSDKPKALETWLQDHGYAVPDEMLPIITAYTEQKLDFVALRLRPGQGVRSMRPVRIVTPGADPTLPLRMVAAGIGSHVGLTLFVLSEGRYRPQNFPEAQIDETKLLWDRTRSRSNYQELSASIMAGASNRTWLTEYADRPGTTGSQPYASDSSLFGAYYNACIGRSSVQPEPIDAGNVDAGDIDAGDIDAGEPDGGVDAGETDAGESDAGPNVVRVPSSVCRSSDDLCCQFDDLETVLSSMHRADVWVTRLRADLPASALNVDLVLGAHPSQTSVGNVHTPSVTGSIPQGAMIARVRSSRLGTGLVMIGTAFLVGRMIRRRRRPT